jgi:hypothetical protein
MIKDSVLKEYEILRQRISLVKPLEELKDLFPQDVETMEYLLYFLLHFITPTYEGIDSLVYQYNVNLTVEEKTKIYPIVIQFVNFCKDEIQGSI